MSDVRCKKKIMKYVYNRVFILWVMLCHASVKASLKDGETRTIIIHFLKRDL